MLTVSGIRSIVTFYQTSTPSSASNGDTWFNPDTFELRVYINGNWVSIGSGGRVATGFENAIDTIAYYNRTGQDYPLQVGEVAKISFSNVTSQPLRIAIPNDSEYNMWVIPSNTGGTSGGTGSPIYLRPNNATYGNAFVWAELYRNSDGASSLYTTYSAFRIGFGFSHIFCVIRNLQQCKNVMGFFESYGYSPAFPAIAIFSTDWRDTTTAWTSLGTIVWPQATSGYILVQRIL